MAFYKMATKGFGKVTGARRVFGDVFDRGNGLLLRTSTLGLKGHPATGSFASTSKPKFTNIIQRTTARKTEESQVVSGKDCETCKSQAYKLLPDVPSKTTPIFNLIMNTNWGHSFLYTETHKAICNLPPFEETNENGITLTNLTKHMNPSFRIFAPMDSTSALAAEKILPDQEAHLVPLLSICNIILPTITPPGFKHTLYISLGARYGMLFIGLPSLEEVSIRGLMGVDMIHLAKLGGTSIQCLEIPAQIRYGKFSEVDDEEMADNWGLEGEIEDNDSVHSGSHAQVHEKVISMSETETEEIMPSSSSIEAPKSEEDISGASDRETFKDQEL